MDLEDRCPRYHLFLLVRLVPLADLVPLVDRLLQCHLFLPADPLLLYLLADQLLLALPVDLVLPVSPVAPVLLLSSPTCTVSDRKCSLLS